MIKVHDRVSFPFVLNANNYLNGFEGIKNKQTEIKPPQEVPSTDPKIPAVAFEIDKPDVVMNNAHNPTEALGPSSSPEKPVTSASMNNMSG
jgi:hypothetical protein